MVVTFFLFFTSWIHVYVCFHQVATMSSSHFYVSHHEPIILLLFIRLLLNSFPSQDKLQMILALNPTLDETSLKNLNSKNLNIEKLLLFSVGATKATPLPGPLPKSKHLLSQCLMEAYNLNGNVLEGIKARADNTLSWTFDVGYYRLKLGSSGSYDSAEHTPTKQIAKLPMNITIAPSDLTDWAIEDNHIEMEAHLVNPDTGFMLKMHPMFGRSIRKPVPFQAHWVYINFCMKDVRC